MKLARSFRRLGFGVALAAMSVACSLNPQPLPPDEAGSTSGETDNVSETSGPTGSSAGAHGGGGASDTGGAGGAGGAGGQGGS